MSNADAAARAATARAAASGQGTNVMVSANDSLRDPRTGLMPHQEGAVHLFVVQAEKYLRNWTAQRGTANLRFEHGAEMANLYAEFRAMLSADPTFMLAWNEASRRLKIGANKQYVREIRIFAPDLLGDYARLLGVEADEPSHRYSMQPVFASGAAGTGYGVKAGVVARDIRVRYENDLIEGLSWEQTVHLEGVVLGFNVSPKASPKPGASGEPPSGWKLAAEQPCRKYLAPDFFTGADYTRPSASIMAKLGAAKAGVGTSSLLLTKGSDRLRWDAPPSVKIGGSVSPEMKDPTKPSADAEAVVESGTATAVGELELKPGKWPEVKYEKEEVSERWIPLHFARLYFATGSPDLDPKDLETLRALVSAIHARDKMEGYRGQIFKIDVSGCHSQKWEAHDKHLRRIDERALAGEITGADLRREEEIEALKQAENEALAFDRAINTREAMKVLLGNIEGKMYLGVMAASKLEEPATHAPIGDDRYANKYEDRSVVVTVSYKLHSPTGAVPAPGGIDWSADNRRSAAEAADDLE